MFLIIFVTVVADIIIAPIVDAFPVVVIDDTANVVADAASVVGQCW